MDEIIAIPDIHGRTFWKQVKNNPINNTIVFLGDYLDPYPQENISFEEALVNFEEIIDFANNQENVILLIGNHDWPYYFNTGNLGWSRYNYKFASEVHTLFKENYNLFRIAYQVDNTLFTHAGVDIDWYEKYNMMQKGIIADQLQAILLSDPDAFKIVSHNRGGRYSFGSPIWSDFADFEFIEKPLALKVRQIVGHTLGFNLRINTRQNIYCLDCKCIFKVTQDNVIKY